MADDQTKLNKKEGYSTVATINEASGFKAARGKPIIMNK